MAAIALQFSPSIISEQADGCLEIRLSQNRVQLYEKCSWDKNL